MSLLFFLYGLGNARACQSAAPIKWGPILLSSLVQLNLESGSEETKLMTWQKKGIVRVPVVCACLSDTGEENGMDRHAVRMDRLLPKRDPCYIHGVQELDNKT